MDGAAPPARQCQAPPVFQVVDRQSFRLRFALLQAPCQVRGALNILFQLATTTGVLAAQVLGGLGVRAEGWE